MPASRSMVLLFAAQLTGLAAAGWWFREALNTDAVAYLRLATYYARGDWSLGLSGYWGPLLSWLMAPGLALGADPLLVARCAMAFSALLFLAGVSHLFRVFQLPDDWKQAGLWTAALVSIPWSVANITPDLLLAGLAAFASSALYQARFHPSASRCLTAGLLWGLAFLAKPVAFPLALVAATWWHLTGCRQGEYPTRAALHRLALFFVGLALVAGGWSALLTRHYGTFTLTHSAAINHAIAGPSNLDRYHPTMRTFHTPPPGRLTTWEDPGQMPYAAWTPWESGSLAWHQIKVALKNLALAQLMLTTLFLDWPVVLAWVVWDRLRRRCWSAASPAPAGEPQLRFALIFLLSLMAIYCPNFMQLGDQRFFYPVLPFLWLLGVGLAERLTRWLPEAGGWMRPALMASFLLPSLVLLFWVLPPKRAAGRVARAVAEHLQAASLGGPVAGSALLAGGRTGLYVAFFLGQPWLGDQLHPTPDDCHRSGASLFIVNRESPLAEALARTPDFVEVPLQPSRDAPTRAALPVRVFRRHDGSARGKLGEAR